MNINELIIRCVTRCEAEAVAMGFPPEAGYDMLCGCVADDTQNWSDHQFLEWTKLMDKKYEEIIKPAISSTGKNPLMDLYAACSKIMGEYGELLPDIPVKCDGPQSSNN